MKGVCHSCDRRLRKGSVRRAWVLSPDGHIASGVVCKRCALRQIVLVVPPPTTVPHLCSKCRKEVASYCLGCVQGLEQNVRELTHANVLMHSSFQKEKN